MPNMDVYVKKGDSDVKKKLDESVKNVEQMGKDFKETKDGLSNMPGGLDSDIAAMIEAAKDTGKQEAEADIESVKASTVKDAKQAASDIKKDVTTKIKDNTTAQSKMKKIKSKYGKKAIDNASKALDANTKKGNDLNSHLDSVINDADKKISDIKSGL